MATHTYSLILLRHGQSQFNNANIFAGWIDVPLSDEGMKQAENAADLLSKAKLYPQVLYTSKLQRTAQTGELILKKLDENLSKELTGSGPPVDDGDDNHVKSVQHPKISSNCEVKRDWRLNERHYGQLQGQSKNEVLKKVGMEQYMFWRRAYTGIPPLLSLEDSKKLIDFEKYSSDFGSIEEIPRAESLEMVVMRLKKLLYNDIRKDLVERGKIVMVAAHGSTVRAMLKMLKKISDDDIKELNIPNCIPLVVKLNENMEMVGDEVYMDPKEAALRSAMVKREGFNPNSNHDEHNEHHENKL